MRATAGDWLLVRSHAQNRPARRGEIVGVGAGGQPPFTVRWTDADHDVMVFPGLDAQVVSAERLAELDRQQHERISVAQPTQSAAS